MTEEMRTRRNPDGTLAYRFGVILNYLFRVDALMHTLGSDFPLHIAHKKIAHLNEQGELVSRTRPTATSSRRWCWIWCICRTAVWRLR